MPVRIGEAIWEGSFADGKGIMQSKTNTFQLGYSVNSRFQDAPETNPEELIGAAHAGCFSMALAKEVNDAGFFTESIKTRSRVHLDNSGKGVSITHIDLLTEARIPAISDIEFQTAFQKAKSCPVSQLIRVPINYEASLIK